MDAIQQYIDTLLSACVPVSRENDAIGESKNYYSRISSFVDESLLKGIPFVLYKIIDRSYNNSTNVDWNYTKILVERNAKRFIRDKHVGIKDLFPDIKVSDLNDMQRENEVISRFMFLVEQKFKEYQNRDVTTEEVNSALDILKETVKEEQIKQTLLTATKILFQGENVINQGKETYMQGSDAMQYLVSELGKISTKYETGSEHIEEILLDSYEKLMYMKTSNTKSYDFVTDTGIKELDEQFGGFMTTQVLGLQGISGVGKSRFASLMMYRAKVKYGKNIYYYSREQHCNELEAYFTSQHIWSKYGVYITDKELKLYDAKLRNVEVELTEEERANLIELTDDDIQIINEAQLDLYSNPSYGKLYLDNTYTPVEKLGNKLIYINNSVMPIDLACIDHMSIVPSDGSLNGGIIWSQTQIVQYGMKLLKNLAQQLNFFCIAINQMTREEVNRALEGKTSRITSGANSSEFEHSSDILLVLGTTPQFDEVNKVFVDNTKARDIGKSSRLILDTRKGICEYKMSATQEEE